MFLLSSALKMGAMTGKQLKHRIIDEEGNTCAIGAIMVAVGIDANAVDRYHHLYSMCPRLSVDGRALAWQIAEKNNEGMTREEIADWLVESGNDCAMVEPAGPVKQEEDMRAAVCV